MTRYNAKGCWDRLVLDWYLPEGRDDITVADIVKVLSVPRQLEQLAGEGAEIVPYEHPREGTLTAVIGPTANNVQSFIMSIWVHEMSKRVIYPIPEGAVRVRSLKDVVDPPFGIEFLLGCMEAACPDWFYGNGSELCVPKGQDVPLLEYAIPRWLTRLEDNVYGKQLGRWLRSDRSGPKPKREDVVVKFTRPETAGVEAGTLASESLPGERATDSAAPAPTPVSRRSGARFPQPLAAAAAVAPVREPAKAKAEPVEPVELTRDEKIIRAMHGYPVEGRRTRSGKPYVRGLEKILGFDITARERNTLWKEVTDV